MDPKDFLDLAMKLNEVGSEAAQRTSVNRCYYATVHFAVRALPSNYRPYPTGHEFHGAVARAIWDAMKSKGLYDKVVKLRRKRKEADYDLEIPWNRYAPKYAYDVASEIILAISAKFPAAGVPVGVV